MKKLNKVLIFISFILLTGCDLFDGGIGYYQVYNNTDSNISIRLYFNSQSDLYKDTVIYLNKKEYSDVYLHYESGANGSKPMIFMCADSIDFSNGDSLLKRYRYIDAKYPKTPYSKEFYDSTYVSSDKKKVNVYTIKPEDFD